MNTYMYSYISSSSLVKGFRSTSLPGVDQKPLDSKDAYHKPCLKFKSLHYDIIFKNSLAKQNFL